MASTHREEEQLTVIENSDGTVEVGGVAVPEDESGEGQQVQSEANIPEDGGADRADDTDEIRRIRREKRKARKEFHNQKRAEQDLRFDQLKSENKQLLERLSAVEKRTQVADVARIDKAMEDEMVRVEYAEMEISKATSSGNGDAMINAQRMLFDAKEKVKTLASIKQRAESNQQRGNAIVPDTTVQRMAGEWMAKNRWYDPNLGNEDSEIAVVVDRRLLKDGFDPKTQEYWDEFTTRLKRTLPHRYNDNGNENGDPETTLERPRSMNVPAERGSTTSGSAAKNTFTLNAQRVAALKEAGMWDDPAKRNKMIRAYAEADRKAGK
jgi:hypothetical protein